MGRPFKQYLDGPRIYSCSTCRSHVADHDDIISKVRLTALACSSTCSFIFCERFSCICKDVRGDSSTALPDTTGLSRAPWTSLPVQQCVSWSI
jgi:hypothetical protein